MNPSSQKKMELPPTETPPHWCDVCCMDLQSAKSLVEHKTGRKHRNRAFQQGREPCPLRDDEASFKSLISRSRIALFVQLPPLHESGAPELGDALTELFEELATGEYKNIVVFSGAGISVAAGVPDFRSAGGLFKTLRKDFGDHFPEARQTPEWLLSRSFARHHPEVWKKMVLPCIQADYGGLQPTLTHHFCAWLHEQKWLRRIYTQNVDGLHLHPSLNITADTVVECHGSMRDGSLVLYGDPLPRRFFDCCDQDFSTFQQVDLVLVFGTSLQVAPFCALPNMAPKGCTCILVNRHIQDCIDNDFSQNRSLNEESFVQMGATSIGKHRHVSLRPLWNDRKASKKWSQLLVESDCDEFVRHFFQSAAAKELGHSLDANASALVL